MTPQVLKPGIEGYSFHFFSNEGNEPRHVHVRKGDGLLKFWLEPTVVLADDNGRMKKQEMKRARELVEKNRSKIIAAWNAHFAR